MTNKGLRDLWNKLQRKPATGLHSLQSVRLKGIRGIDDLKVEFNYPVSVLAGESGSGKSTVLFAAACAYKVQGGGARRLVPSLLFPNYQPKSGRYRDLVGVTTFEFEYLTPDGGLSMKMQRNYKNWNRSFFGREDVDQPKRPVYLRTLANLTNPSEVGGVAGLSRMQSELQETRLTLGQIKFAQQLLSFKYSEVTHLSRARLSYIDSLRGREKGLLFAIQENGLVYSELHMAAGERALLRLSQEIAQAEGALVLIDEVETGLHPFAQKILMQELQRLALRNNLQIIVTTHSPAVLDSVDETGRIFLERSEAGKVSVHPPYRDLIQDAVYGRLEGKFNLLCEDRIAESFLQGVFDIIAPSLNARRESIRIGRDTGAEEFPVHAKALERFAQFQTFIFVLDGDKRGTNLEQRIQSNTRQEARVVFLPGEHAPEAWVWGQLEASPDHWAQEMGMVPENFSQQINRLNLTYNPASDPFSEIAKFKLHELSEAIGRPDTEICRMVARWEAGRAESDIQSLVAYLKEAFREWRGET